jgi:molecular chaperone DnaJ
MDNKNYYEILQVNKNASKEVIDKTYKFLIKKYHPDLQDDSKKEEYEEIIKIINEAYETLSDKQKRKEYDNSLTEDIISKDEYNKLYNENQKLKQELDNMNNYLEQELNNTKDNVDNLNTTDEQINKQDNTFYQDYEEKINEAVNKAYHDAYIQDLKNRGYKIKYKKTFKDYFTSFISIIIFLFIILLIFQIPFVKNYFIQNEFVKFIINLF